MMHFQECSQAIPQQESLAMENLQQPNQHKQQRRSKQDKINKTDRKTSRFRGVVWNKQRHCWQASIHMKCKGKKDEYHFLGLYGEEELAARVFDFAKLKYKGSDAKGINFEESRQQFLKGNVSFIGLPKLHKQSGAQISQHDVPHKSSLNVPKQLQKGGSDPVTQPAQTINKLFAKQLNPELSRGQNLQGRKRSLNVAQSFDSMQRKLTQIKYPTVQQSSDQVDNTQSLKQSQSAFVLPSHQQEQQQINTGDIFKQLQKLVRQEGPQQYIQQSQRIDAQTKAQELNGGCSQSAYPSPQNQHSKQQKVQQNPFASYYGAQACKQSQRLDETWSEVGLVPKMNGAVQNGSASDLYSLMNSIQQTVQQSGQEKSQSSGQAEAKKVFQSFGGSLNSFCNSQTIDSCASDNDRLLMPSINLQNSSQLSAPKMNLPSIMDFPKLPIKSVTNDSDGVQQCAQVCTHCGHSNQPASFVQETKYVAIDKQRPSLQNSSMNSCQDSLVEPKQEVLSLLLQLIQATQNSS